MSMRVLVLYKSTESVKHFQWQIQDITGGANPNGVYQNNIAPNVSKPAWNEENWAGGDASEICLCKSYTDFKPQVF